MTDSPEQICSRHKRRSPPISIGELSYPALVFSNFHDKWGRGAPIGVKVAKCGIYHNVRYGKARMLWPRNNGMDLFYLHRNFEKIAELKKGDYL